MTRYRWTGLLICLAAMVLVAGAVLQGIGSVSAQEAAAGFNGFIRSGTCAAPTSTIFLDLETDDDYDVMPYLAKIRGQDETVTLAYYGAPEVPGFGYSTIFTDEVFSLVIVDGESGDPVACGDILEPDDDNYVEVGLALVQLFPVDGSGVGGYAVVERAPMQREDDIITARVRILLTTDEISVAPPAASPQASPVATT